ncbi:MAG: hypothetical protein HYS13_00600 [Planctomycetia bacterium]|nr:hypothetical protein [Planctomycetia bacterium]
MAQNSIPGDTTLEAARVQLEIFRRMTPEERSRLASELTAAVRRLAAEGVRARHPEYTADQVRLAEIRLWLGDELFHEVYPGVDVEP